MALEKELKDQLKGYLEMMEGPVEIGLHIGDDPLSAQMNSLIEEISNMSVLIKVKTKVFERIPSFSIDRPNEDSAIVFSGLPLGHEFSSMVLALVQVSGRKPKVDDTLIRRIMSIDFPIHFDTYVRLSCRNCAEVVQAMNIMCVINPNISHTMIEGEAFKAEFLENDVYSVPVIHMDGEYFDVGRMSIEEILSKLGI